MFICLLYFFCGLSRDGSGNTWHPVSSHFILHPLMVADKILGHCLGAKRQSGERDENSSHVVRKWKKHSNISNVFKSVNCIQNIQKYTNIFKHVDIFWHLLTFGFGRRAKDLRESQRAWVHGGLRMPRYWRPRSHTKPLDLFGPVWILESQLRTFLWHPSESQQQLWQQLPGTSQIVLPVNVANFANKSASLSMSDLLDTIAEATKHFQIIRNILLDQSTFGWGVGVGSIKVPRAGTSILSCILQAIINISMHTYPDPPSPGQSCSFCRKYQNISKYIKICKLESWTDFESFFWSQARRGTMSFLHRQHLYHSQGNFQNYQ